MSVLVGVRGAVLGAGCVSRVIRTVDSLRCISSTGAAEDSVPTRVTAAQPQGAPAPLHCFRLPCRALLHITGPDTASLLQGIITNDVRLLEQGQRALYSHLLNVQGRTLFDVIIYSVNEGTGDLSEVLLECDSSVLDSMTRHLKVYKLRRQVCVAPRSDLSLWALLRRNTDSAQDHLLPQKTNVQEEQPLVLVEDPRSRLMGWRMITNSTENPAELLAACEQGNPQQYHMHRYTIGLPEGMRDLPPGEALPLESNLVFMNGISFSKGCYLGQELTARTHHTGVVRKRLLPLRLSDPAQNLQPGAILASAEGKAAGKFRAGLGELGLGLVRLAHANKPLTIRHSTDCVVTAHASVPDWWPKDNKQ